MPETSSVEKPLFTEAMVRFWFSPESRNTNRKFKGVRFPLIKLKQAGRTSEKGMYTSCETLE